MENRCCVACLLDETKIAIKTDISEDIIETYKILVQYEVNQLNHEPKDFCSKCVEKLTLIQNFMKKCLKSIEKLKKHEPEENSFITVFIKQEILEEQDESEIIEHENVEIKYLEESSQPDEVQFEVNSEQSGVKSANNFPNLAEIEVFVPKKLGRPKKKEEEKKKVTRNTEQIYCAHCHKYYFNRVSLARHIRKKHQGGLECKYCCRIFMDREKYEIHMTEKAPIEKEAKESGKKEKSYFCEHCGYSTPHNSTMHTHMQMYHLNESEKICDFCGKGFKLKHALVQHMRRRHMEKKHFCSECNEKFPELHLLRKHEKFFHSEGSRPDGNAQCKFCGDFFKAHYLMKHIQGVHMKLKLYKCEHCNNSFDTAHQRYMHVKRVHEIENVTCELCAKEMTKQHYRRHMASVHDVQIAPKTSYKRVTMPKNYQREAWDKKKRENQAKRGKIKENGTDEVKKEAKKPCEQCDEIFASSRELKQHQIRKHYDSATLSKYMPCQVCEDLVLKRGMWHHLTLTHSDTKQFQCGLCKSAFKSKGGLDEHHNTKHLGIKMFKCTHCSEAYDKNSLLRRHFERIHGLTYTAEELRNVLGLRPLKLFKPTLKQESNQIS
ncbi:zinc finger protein 729-like [Culicoides brevitarsis]|uniref:zinc finger protein 729-like n=1 Tax=Culicoides brevitarsis TaxID=469753 RepID=UPI00307B6B0E